MFVRVRDRDTGHQYDIPEGDPRIGVLVELVNKPHYPPSHFARRPKHHTDLAGRPVPRQPVPPGEGATTEKESPHA